MNGRILGVKKSTVMRISFFINLVLCLFLIFFSIFFWKNYFLWFFVFCFFAGAQTLMKAFLFRMDSATYIGFELLLLGISGFLSYFFAFPFKPLILLFASGLASLLTFLFTKQQFHVFGGVLMSVSGLVGFLYAIKILNLAIFLAIFLIFLFIFSLTCVILIIRYLRNGKKGEKPDV